MLETNLTQHYGTFVQTHTTFSFDHPNLKVLNIVKLTYLVCDSTCIKRIVIKQVASVTPSINLYKPLMDEC